MKSRPRTTSAAFFIAPRIGTALRPVSSAPPKNPFRRMVAATVASATAVPIHGILRAARLDSRAPPQRAMRPVIVITAELCKCRSRAVLLNRCRA
jgi:hypothetical protein